ncbi:uncharacterized protein LOC128549524 [Mercenaria mercenaria]|uniref:uncharacterized protein LOC128549524 n=1 Tax=Mercenaria mercenaria TaxID=6596 RepID=UPI00234F0C82|nr:uncharacterized protein LOC128549524 [Mercenaria mercenaria]
MGIPQQIPRKKHAGCRIVEGATAISQDSGILTSVGTAGVNTMPSHVLSVVKSRPQQQDQLSIQSLPLPFLGQTKNKVVTPVKIEKLLFHLLGHQHYGYLVKGFSQGFDIGYIGPRRPVECKNLKSCYEFPSVIQQHIESELALSRIQGPFKVKPFPNFQLSPIGLVKKKTPGQYRFIQNLSHPKGNSFNDFIRPELAMVKYMSFDDAALLVRQLGQACYMAKTDIANAFRIIPIRPEDHELLGFQFGDAYYYNVCLVMGSSSSCAIFET